MEQQSLKAVRGSFLDVTHPVKSPEEIAARLRFIEDGLMLIRGGKVAWFGEWDQGKSRIPGDIRIREDLHPDEVVMESTGIYWKSPYAALEAVGIYAKVVNARHVKNVPGRKTDVSDAQWLATLSRAGLLRASFIAPKKMRELRLVSRQRQKLVGLLASEKNRMHKVLVDGGIRLGVVVSDVHGQSARAMIKALIENKAPHEVLAFATKRLKGSREKLFDALQGELTNSHRFVLAELMQHIENLEQRIARFDQHLLAGLQDNHTELALLQTLPGVDLIGAAMLLVEIGTCMDTFGSADRLASWVGICPGNNESAGKRKSGRIRKGNPYVRRLLCEFAHAASRTASFFKAKFQSLALRRGYKRSIVAIAHKLLRTIFFILKQRKTIRIGLLTMKNSPCNAIPLVGSSR